jgi:RNA polymerase-binding transcription factor DksA
MLTASANERRILMSITQQTELRQVRQRLETLREELLERERCVHRDLTRQEQALSADFAEQAVEVQNDAALQAIGAVAEVELGEIDAALRRLDLGDYGVCRDCGQGISPQRLAVLPQAVTCSACAL